MSVLTLYSIPQVVNLTTSDGAPLMNYALTKSDFTIHAYVDNVIDILVRNVDRQMVSFANCAATIYIQDSRTQRLVLTRDLNVMTDMDGHLQFTVTGEEAAAFPRRDLQYSVVMTRPDNTSLMLFTDRDQNAVGVVHVKDGPVPFPKEPVLIYWDDFMHVDCSRLAGSFPGGALTDSYTHTVAMSLNTFTGNVSVEASRELLPSQNSEEWFVVTEVTFSNQTGLVPLTFEGTYNWVRFRVSKAGGIIMGTIDKLTYRN